MSTSNKGPALVSRFFIPTLRSVSDDLIVSNQLMLRAGMMRRSSNGIYSILPLGVRTLDKLEDIVDTELQQAGCTKLSMPIMLSGDLWKETGRWESTGKELIRLHDRTGHEYCLGPTHEECITDIVRTCVTSHEQLPLRLYQIGRKYRDEVRPRFGMMRAREFLMKDMYSFDKDMSGAEETYEVMMDSYTNIMNTLELDWAMVEADNGNIGGIRSHEFHVLSDVGEDTLLSCSSCSYAANVEMARGTAPASSGGVQDVDMEVGGQRVRVTLAHGDEVNTVKLTKAVGALDVSKGADKETVHVIDVQCTHERVGDAALHADVRTARHDDTCPECNHGRLQERRGIEVGHIFLLGTHYSTKLDACVPGPNGSATPMHMGCYGLGLTRIVAAMIETNHDAQGIRWNASLAPFHTAIVPLLHTKKALDEGINGELMDHALRLHSLMPNADDVILDDRRLGAGVKLTDAALVGYPKVVVVSAKTLASDAYEVQDRRSGHVETVDASRALELLEN